MIPTNRQTVPTIEKSFLPTAERSLPSPNDSYRPLNHSYHRRTVPTIAEPFLPSPNNSYRPPNRSYHRRTVCTIVNNTDW
ncbi:MAG: hypothetical protein KDI02_19335 [Anaerolineae bacterium]|nr:hypothetical protein [Anaerolineae bacterium]